MNIRELAATTSADHITVKITVGTDKFALYKTYTAETGIPVYKSNDPLGHCEIYAVDPGLEPNALTVWAEIEE